MLTDDFDYHLPDGAIAQHPAPRGESRLLVMAAEGSRRHRRTGDLPEILRPGDLLVVNDTRVLAARLFGRRREGGGKVELLLSEKLGPMTWEALAKPGRRLRPGIEVDFADGLMARVEGKNDEGRCRFVFSEEVEPHLETSGHMPLPPYIKRQDDADDKLTYQTVFAQHPGAIAAPTAGLHFDAPLLQRLAAAGIERAAVTLHVGLGTFKPVTADLVHEHRMETERYVVPQATAQAIRRTQDRGGRIVAVGTTVVRTLESAIRQQGEALTGEGRTELFITPGFDFRVVDVLLTNFHLPRSTLLMLVSAFAGRQDVLAAYQEAIAEGYRFYSYGDAMLLQRAR